MRTRYAPRRQRIHSARSDEEPWARQRPGGNDLRGNALGTRFECRARCREALWRLMSFYDVPLADLDQAIAADPGWACRT
jgi:hypothetical protein